MCWKWVVWFVAKEFSSCSKSSTAEDIWPFNVAFSFAMPDMCRCRSSSMKVLIFSNAFSKLKARAWNFFWSLTVSRLLSSTCLYTAYIWEEIFFSLACSLSPIAWVILSIASSGITGEGIAGGIEEDDALMDSNCCWKNWCWVLVSWMWLWRSVLMFCI